MKATVIGLCGAEGAGKSTVAKIMTDITTGAVLPFAKPLKDMMISLGVPPQHIYGTPEDKLQKLPLLGGKSARQALQFLGTEWGRDLIHPNLWANAWSVQVEKHAHDELLIVADDVRFANEVHAVRSHGGKVVRVRRPSVELSLEERMSAHPSSRWWDLDYDFEISNDGDEVELKRQVSRLFLELAKQEMSDKKFLVAK